jgi:Zn-finger nucleic acid-binding protein
MALPRRLDHWLKYGVCSARIVPASSGRFGPAKPYNRYCPRILRSTADAARPLRLQDAPPKVVFLRKAKRSCGKNNKATMISCPSCCGEMRRVIESGVEIDVCDGCSAIWLDPGELNDVAKSVDNDVADVIVREDSPRKLSCPRCGGDDFCELQIITKLLAQPIEVARCEGCSGVFVDNDNLDRLRGQLPDLQAEASHSTTEPANASTTETKSEPGIVTEVAAHAVGEGLVELLIHVICSIG